MSDDFGKKKKPDEDEADPPEASVSDSGDIEKKKKTPTHSDTWPPFCDFCHTTHEPKEDCVVMTDLLLQYDIYLL